MSRALKYGDLTAAQEEHVKAELNPVDTDTLYDEFLDELGDVEIGGLTYSHAHAFKKVDPIAYRCGFSDFEDSLLRDGDYYEIDEELYDAGEVNDLTSSTKTKASQHRHIPGIPANPLGPDGDPRGAEPVFVERDFWLGGVLCPIRSNPDD